MSPNCGVAELLFSSPWATQVHPHIRSVCLYSERCVSHGGLYHDCLHWSPLRDVGLPGRDWEQLCKRTSVCTCLPWWETRPLSAISGQGPVTGTWPCLGPH